MPTEEQRLEASEINRLAFELCDMWQSELRRPVSIDEISGSVSV